MSTTYFFIFNVGVEDTSVEESVGKNIRTS